MHDGVSVRSGASNSLKELLASLAGSILRSPSFISSSAMEDVDDDDGVDIGLSIIRFESLSATEIFSRRSIAESSNMN